MTVRKGVVAIAVCADDLPVQKLLHHLFLGSGCCSLPAVTGSYAHVLSAQKPKTHTREYIVTKKRAHDGRIQECGSCCRGRGNNVLHKQKGCKFWWLLCKRFLPITSASQQASVVLRWHGALRRNSFFNLITKTSQHTITLLLLDKRQSLLNRNALPGLRRQFPS